MKNNELHSDKNSVQQESFLKKQKNYKVLITAIQIFILKAFFGLWEVFAYIDFIDDFIFSSPSRMYQMLLQLLYTGELFSHIGITSLKVIIGFSLGTLIGTAIALLLWSNDMLRRVLNPYLVIFNSLPKTALAPIIIVWVGNNMQAVIVTALLISVIVTILNVLTGFLQVEEDKIKLAQSFCATRLQVITKVIMPASVPSIVNALKVNLGLSFVGVIVGEFLVANQGLGFLIVHGSQMFRMDMVMLSIIILSILASFMHQIIVVLEKKFDNWK